MEKQHELFRDANAVAGAVLVSLAVGLLFDAYAIVYVTGHLSEAALQPPLPWGRLHLLVRLATCVSFFMWIDRAYANLAALGREAEHERYWSVLSFFIPPFLFFRPCQIVLETWQQSATPRASRSRVPAVIIAWWVLLLSPPAVIVASYGIDAAGKARSALLTHVVNVLAAGAAMFIVRAITQQQEALRVWQVREVENEERRARMAALRAAAAGTTAAPALPPPPPAAAAFVESPFELREPPPPVRPRTQEAPRPYVPVPLITPRPQARVKRTASTWRSAAGWIVVAVAVITILAGASVALRGDVLSQIRGGVHGFFGLILIGAWLSFRRMAVPDAPDERSRWLMIAGAGAVMAVMNLVVLAGVLTR